MIIHFNAGMQGTGRLVNLPPSASAPPDLVPRIAPNIDTAANWPSGFTANMLFAGNFVTNATPVLEHFSLIYEEHPGNQPLFHNSEDPRLGFGHGIVVHKRAEIRNCAISGFPGDGIRLTGTNSWTTRFEDGMRIWGFHRYLSTGELMFNPPNPDNTFNDHSADLPFTIVVKYLTLISNAITENLAARDISFIQTGGNTLTNATAIDNLTAAVEILPGGDPDLAPFITVTATGATPTIGDINIEISADPAPAIPWGIHPVRIAGSFTDTSGNPVNFTSEKFYLYVCNDKDNNYPARVYTNVNSSHLYNVRITNCGRHGMYVAYLDSNAGATVGGVFERNGGWGLYEASGLGNTYIGCHSAQNGLGAYYTPAESYVSRNLFVGCTGQGAVLIHAPSQWIGGSNQQAASYTPEGYMQNGAAVLNKGGVFPLFRQKIRFNNIANLVPNAETGPPGAEGVFFDAGGQANQIAGFGNLQEKDWDLALTNLPVDSSNNYDMVYAFVRQSLDKGRPLALTGLFSAHLPPGMPWLQNPFFISNNNIAGSGPRVRVTVGEGAPKEEQVYWNGFPVQVPGISPEGLPISIPLFRVLGNVGDIYFNSLPENTEDNKYVAYICTASFVYNESYPLSSTGAVWKPFWLINF